MTKNSVLDLRNISAQTLSKLAFAAIALVLSANSLRPDKCGRIREDHHIGKKAVPVKGNKPARLLEPQ